MWVKILGCERPGDPRASWRSPRNICQGSRMAQYLPKFLLLAVSPPGHLAVVPAVPVPETLSPFLTELSSAWGRHLSSHQEVSCLCHTDPDLLRELRSPCERDLWFPQGQNEVRHSCRAQKSRGHKYSVVKTNNVLLHCFFVFFLNLNECKRFHNERTVQI